MKLTKKQEAEIWNTYNTWMHGYLNADLDTYDRYLDDDYHFIGSTNNEEFLNRKDTTDFFRATGDQFAGMTDLRNETKTLEQFDNLIFLTHIFDAWFKNDKDWTYYGKFRFSSVMKQRKEGWRFIYQHFSMPDSKSEEGQTIGFDKVNAENQELREAIKRRTVELEEKNRELEIEGALERIRAQAVAMKTSSDLLDIVVTMRDEFIELGHEAHYFWHMMWLPNKFEKAMTSGDGSKIGMIMELARDFHSYYEGMDEWENSDEPIMILPLKTDDAIDYIDRMVSQGDFQLIDPNAPTEEDLRHIGGVTFIMARTSHGEIGYSLPGVVKNPPKEDLDILVQFAGAFDLAHRRFLDLQKAEKQAREVQIELALEKVRSRTMGMQLSDELRDTAMLLFQQVEELGINSFACGFNIWDDDKKAATAWMASKDRLQPPFKTNSAEDVYLLFHKAEKRGESLFVLEQQGKELEDHYKYLVTIPEVKKLSEAGLSFPKFQIIHCAYFSKGYLMFITLEPVPEAHDIFKRFAKVFEQTYTRFLDLQKAEAQAREAQIEAALERVRAHSNAMHQSEDLANVVTAAYEELRLLDSKILRCGIGIVNAKSKSVNAWITSDLSSGASIELSGDEPLSGHPLLESIFDYWKEQKNLSYLLEGKDLIEYYKTVIKIDFQKHFAKEGLDNAHIKHYYHCIMFPAGGLYVFKTSPILKDQINILQRFADAFNRAYIRHQDLQKAEAQAREAHIETALERVRSQSMGMQTSKDLSKVTTEMFKQLRLFDGDLYATGIVFCDKHKGHVEQWHSIPNAGMMSPFIVPIDLDYIHQYRYDQWKKGTELFSIEIPSDFIQQHFNDIFKLPSAQKVLKDFDDQNTPMPEAPSWEIDYGASFKNGYLLVSSLQPFKEAEILPRFAKVFEQTYTRFLDLQKAEAQAREAQIEASLERVRSRAMAIQTSNELDEVIQIIFEELGKLDVQLMECSIATYDINPKDLIFCSAGPIGALQPKSVKLQYFDHPILNDLFKDLENGIKYRSGEFSGKILKTWWDRVFTKTDFKNAPKKFIASWKSVKSIFYSQFAIKHGFLEFLGNSPLEKDKVQLLERFTKVIDLTYSRYDDVVKAEYQAREAQIEAALERVRSRSMAMHKSEELKEVIQVVYDQFIYLDINIEHTGFIIDYKKNEDMHIWLADQKAVFPEVILPYFDCAHWNSFKEAKKKGHNLFTNLLDFKEKNKFYKDLFKFIPDLPKEVKNNYLSCPGLAISTVLLDNIGLYIENFKGDPYSDDENEILMRFGKVFQQTYTRFLDLQKAEAQARESQIEMALEKVRSRTMAMQNSSELPEAANNLFLQVQELGIPAWSAGYCIWEDEDKKSTSCNMSSEGEIQKGFSLPTIGEGYNFYKPYKKGEPFYVAELGGKKLVKHYDFMRTLPVVGEIFEEFDKKGISLPTFQIFHIVYFTHGYLMFITYEAVLNDWDVFKRFGSVFEQTFTRFLDLQKAESQTREAQINLGVERVRAKALAMHKSEEIIEVVAKLKDEVMGLDIPDVVAATIFLNEGDDKVRMWDLSSLEHDDNYLEVPFDLTFKIKKTDPHLYVKRVWENQESYFVEIQDEKGFKRLMQWLRELHKNEIADEVEDFIEKTQLKRLYHTAKKLNNGKLVIDLLNPPSDEMETILTKMGAAFDLAYKRFEDLKKAEAQTREAQIEAALEKVRSRSLAMHKPDELQEVVAIVAEKLKDLGVIFDAGGVILCTYFPDNKDVLHWITVEDFSTSGRYFVPYFDNPIFNDAWDSKIKGDAYFSKEFPVEAKNDFFKQAFENSDYKQMPKDYKQHVLKADKHHLSAAWSKNSAIIIPSLTGAVPSESDAEIMKRFAKVFEQAYIRFLDLQKAEAQTREAQIEAALEKVRSRSLAMHKSEELQEVVLEVHEKFQELDISMESRVAVIVVFEEDSRNYNQWIASDDFSDMYISTPYFKHRVLDDFWKAKHKGVNFYSGTYTEDEKNSYFQTFFEISNYKRTAAIEAQSKWVYDQKFYTYSPAFQKNSSVGLADFSGIPLTEGEIEIIKRFSKVFEQAYIRFLDLQKAEAQARESQIEAALERVRARALAMHNPEELKEVAHVLRTEMGLLGVDELETCSIYINDEETEKTECWYAIKDIRSKKQKLINDHFELDLNDTWVGKEMLKFYMSKNNDVSIVMSGKNRKEWIDYCEKQSAPLQGYYGEEIPDRTYHLYKFSHGAIGVATAADISDENWNLIKRTASTFSLAYSRFKDLTQARIDLAKLKEEKKRAEDALSELQLTQTQLIQSEKMASLGELTAGIAHEIQNPLNFVNNFSEVSKELLDEMIEELENGDMEEVKAITDDVIQNLEKINHHGKRADGIVKGMLQHSRSSTGTKEPTDINVLGDEYLRLAYHGLRAKDKGFNATLVTDFDEDIGAIDIIPQDIGRVVLNLLTNAFYVVNEKKQLNIDSYEPTVSLTTKKNGNLVSISVKDNGNGIPKKVVDKIFQPFFTTKPTGEGTGLGLSMSYDIVTKGHGGELKVETKQGEGTEFVIILPIKS